MATEQKHNPKYVEAQKRGKADYSAIPWEAIWGLVLAMMEGMGKYGRFNFIEDEIEARTYIGAIGRHLFGDPSTGSKGWVNGEDIDEESGLHHLDKVMACCLLVRAAEIHGKLIDNRMTTESLTPPSMLFGEGEAVTFDIPETPKLDVEAFARMGAMIRTDCEGDKDPIIDGPHAPTREEIIDMERSPVSPIEPMIAQTVPDHLGPWDVVFTKDIGAGIEKEQRRGPYETVEQAEDYARRNPEQLPGLIAIQPSTCKVRETNA